MENLQKIWRQKAINKGFIDKYKFISLRPVLKGYIYTNISTASQNYSTTARCGTQFFYNEKDRILYNWGRGVYIIYEKGIWANDKINNYEIY